MTPTMLDATTLQWLLPLAVLALMILNGGLLSLICLADDERSATRKLLHASLFVSSVPAASLVAALSGPLLGALAALLWHLALAVAFLRASRRPEAIETDLNLA